MRRGVLADMSVIARRWVNRLVAVQVISIVLAVGATSPALCASGTTARSPRWVAMEPSGPDLPPLPDAWAPAALGPAVVALAPNTTSVRSVTCRACGSRHQIPIGHRKLPPPSSSPDDPLA